MKKKNKDKVYGRKGAEVYYAVKRQAPKLGEMKCHNCEKEKAFEELRYNQQKKFVCKDCSPK